MNKIKKILHIFPFLPFVGLVVLFLFFPLVNIVINGFLEPGTRVFTLRNFAELFTKPIYTRAIKNSMIISFTSTFIALLLSFMTALALTKLQVNSRSRFMAFLNMVANFGGLPLAYAFMIMIGTAGVFVLIFRGLGFDILKYFSLYSTRGFIIIYVYFSVTGGTLLLYPAFQGIRQEWKESALLMRANAFQFWWYVGLPVLIPSLTGTFGMIYAGAVSAYTVIFVLMNANYPLMTIKIASMVVGEMQSQTEMASALSLVMVLLMLIVIALCNLFKKIWYKGDSK
jgi:putative spermidine/putrescine transport system permease protein